MTENMDQRPQYPPKLHLGRNHGRTFFIIAIVIAVHLWFFGIYAYGWIFQPNATLNDGEPIRTQVDFSIIPALPEDLAVEYDAIREAQVEQLNGGEPNTIAIDRAIELALETGYSVREGDIVINEDTSDDIVVGNDREPGDGIGVADDVGG